MSKSLTLSLVIVALIIGIGFGYYLTPEYANLKSLPSHEEGLGKPDKYLDLRYINGMIAHHQSAIYMLEQVKKETKRNELKELADVIIKLDTQGIKDLYDLKLKIYNDKREVKKFNKVELGSFDEKFDLRFLNAMIIHHEEAIKVSGEALSKSTLKESLVLADGVIALLGENLKLLKDWRANWYGVK